MSRIDKLVRYEQTTEPVLAQDGDVAIWQDTSDNDRTYLVQRRGSSDQVKVELDANAAGSAHGSLAITAGASTALSQDPTWTKLNGTFGLATYSRDFDQPVNGRLRYIGLVTRTFLIEAGCSLNADQTVTYAAGIYKNGTTPYGARVAAKCATTGVTFSLGSVTALVELAYGDYVELWGATYNGTANVTASPIHITAVAIPSVADSQLQADTALNRTVQTTNNTATTIATYTTKADERAISMRATVFAREPATDDSAKYVIEALFNRSGSSVVTSKNVDPVSTFEDQAAWGVSFNISGQDIQVQVTGENSKTIEWRCQLEVNEHG